MELPREELAHLPEVDDCRERDKAVAASTHPTCMAPISHLFLRCHGRREGWENSTTSHSHGSLWRTAVGVVMLATGELTGVLEKVATGGASRSDSMFPKLHSILFSDPGL
jgi:hypothetical protein